MCWGRVGDYEYLAKYSGKFQKYFSNQVNKRIHPPTSKPSLRPWELHTTIGMLVQRATTSFIWVYQNNSKLPS